jgi:hypothetical protein
MADASVIGIAVIAVMQTNVEGALRCGPHLVQKERGNPNAQEVRSKILQSACLVVSDGRKK